MSTRFLSLLAVTALLTTTAPKPAVASFSGTDAAEVETSYHLLTSEFYKKVDPQILLDGARNGLEEYLKAGGTKTVSLPSLRSSGDEAKNVRTLEREIASAASLRNKLPDRDFTYAAISGMLASVHDKYTVFLNPKDFAALNEGLDGGNFSGVGIAIQVEDDSKYLFVNDVIADGPAEKAGVQRGDVIVSVNGKSTKGLTTEQDAKMLRGKEGTIAQISIRREGKLLPNPIAVTRAVIHDPSVSSRLLSNGIGYARLKVFGSTTAGELTQALDKLESQGAKAYVLDLRDNGGGYLNAAIDVSSKFIPSGPIVSVESRGGADTQYDADDTAIPSKPLAVLVNKYTASASEITSAAIQDSGVGELIGERTFGKGVVQTIHPLPDGSAVKITSARYLTPHGHDINLIGIAPDIISLPTKNSRLGDPARDPQLQAAISYLQKRLAQIAASN